MNGIEFLSKIEQTYPKEKPIAFNYTEARRMLIALAGRVANLEARLAKSGRKEN